MSETKFNWHKVSKSYQGGSHDFQIQVPAIKLSKDDWECILEWLGEHTSGGRAYGYSMRTRKIKSKSDKLPVVKYPAGLCPKTFDYGSDVTITTSMI